MILKRVIGLEKLATLIPVLAKENSQNAWKELVQITGNDLHRYICYFIHDTEHASDILQEVYILFLRDIKIFVKVSSQENEEIAAKKIYAWLYKTARNKSFDLIKKKKNGLTAKTLLTQQATTREHTMPVNNLEKKETNEIIKYELSFLNEKQQNLLTLKFFHEKSNLEIAREINCEVISVPKLIDRALAQLKKRLEKVGITLSLTLISESLVNKAMCADIPTNLLPEVFQLYQTAPKGGVLINSITLKGILMKSLYIIVGATIISTLLYLNTPTQEQNKTEIAQKTSHSKEIVKIQNIESVKSTEITKEMVSADINTNGNIDTTKTMVKIYQIENPVITFKINSISQLKEDYKKSPYFQFANSPATGGDFDRIDFSKIFDLYNEGILNLKLTSSDLKIFFNSLNNAKSFEYQADLETSFTLKIEYFSEEDAKKNLNIINKWLPKRIEESKKKFEAELKQYNPLNNDSIKSAITGDHEIYYKTKTDISGNSIYIYNGAKEESLAPLNISSHSNISLDVKLNDKFMKNNSIKSLVEALNIDTSMQINVNYDLNSAGLSENIRYQINNEEKQYFDLVQPTETMNEFLRTTSKSNIIVTHIKPNYLFNSLKMIASLGIENLDQKLMVLNLICFQKFQKNIETLIKENLSGEIALLMNTNGTYILVGLTKENNVSKILDDISKDGSLPFQKEIIKNQYLKITIDPFIDANISSSSKFDKFDEKEHLFYSMIQTKSAFKDLVEERVALAQKYSELDISVKECLPLLVNEQIYSLFENPTVYLKSKNINNELNINSPIPYFFCFIFGKALEWKGYTVTSSDAKTLLPNSVDVGNSDKGLATIEIHANDKTLFSRETQENSTTKELLYFDEKGQVEYSYTKKDKNEILVEKYNKNKKVMKKYFLLDGKKNNEFTSFDNNGNLTSRGSYQSGNKTGTWTFYSNNELLGEIEYLNGFPTYSFEIFHANRNLHKKVELDKSGNGSAMVYFKNGEVHMEGIYKNYKRINCWKVYSPGQKLLLEVFHDFFGQKQKIISYYENQAKHFEIPYKNNFINGKVLEYYPNGKIKGEYEFAKGVPKPKWTYYEPEGKVSGEWLDDNSYTGILKEDSKDGTPQIEYTFTLNEENDQPTKINNFIIEIEQKLNINYSRVSEEITSSVNGPSINSLVKLTPHLSLRGYPIQEFFAYYGMISDKKTIMESINYQINSWNYELGQFVENSPSDSYFIMSSNIIYKIQVSNNKVLAEEFLEFDNELF